MVKEFCDNCKRKVNRNYVDEQLEGKSKKWRFEIILAFQDVWNDGCLCKKCLKELVQQALKELVQQAEKDSQ